MMVGRSKQKWTSGEEEELMRRLRGDETIAQIADAMGRTYSSIDACVRRLGREGRFEEDGSQARPGHAAKILATKKGGRTPSRVSLPRAPWEVDA